MYKKKKLKILLTIFYSTYNRKKLILRRVKNILKKKIPNFVEVIILDDKSSDSTYEALKKITKNTFIKIYRNKKKTGFAGNFVQSIIKANGKFVIWASDKDDFSMNGINFFIKWYKKKDRVDVAVLNYTRNLKIKKDHIKFIRKNNTRLITSNDLWKCSHATGIIWRTKAVSNISKYFNLFSKKYPSLCKTYPNLMLLVKMLPKKKCFFFNNEITYQASYAKRSYFSEGENSFFFLKSRWSQHKDLLNFLNDCSKNKKYNLFYKSIMHSVNLNLFSFLSSAIREEKPELYSYWLSGAYSPLQIFKRFVNVFFFAIKYSIYDFSWVLNKVKKRINLIFYKH